ncbi:MAG: iron-containing alcohol dehydrogenase [Pirellulales bacterium]
MKRPNRRWPGRADALDLRTADDAEAATMLIAHIVELCRRLNVPQTLTELGVRREQLSELVAGSHGNSLSGNPRTIDDAELTQILERML